MRSEEPDWQPWLEYFLGALQQQKRRLENKIRSTNDSSVTQNLNKIYLHLVNLYCLVGKEQEAENIIAFLAQRCNDIHGFKIFNELANILRKYRHYEPAVSYY